MKKIIICFGISTLIHAHDYFFDCFWGNYSQLKRDYGTAEKYFKKLGTHTHAGLQGYISLLFEKKEFEHIVSLAKDIDTYCQDAQTQILLIKALELCGKSEMAEKKLIALSTQFPNNQEIIYGAAISCIRQNQADSALTIIDSYLQSVAFERQTDFVFYFLKAQIYFALKQYAQAKDQVERLLRMNPNFEQGWLLSGLIHELSGDIDQAINGYQSFLKLTGNKDPYIEQQIMNLVLKKKITPETASINIQDHLNTALRLYHAHQYEKSLDQLTLCLKQDPACKTAILLTIEILCQTHQLSKALVFIKQIIQARPQEQEWYRCLHILYHAHASPALKEEIIQMLETLHQESSKNLLALLYVTDMHIETHHHDKAIEYLRKAENLAKTTQLKSRIQYQLAKIYYQHKNYRVLDDFLSTLPAHHHYIPLYNLCAYYYATQGKQLKKAQEFINKALKIDKNNIHCLDTQALIWYKEGHFTKAYNLLIKLSSKNPSDFFIQKHLGKTLYALGNIPAAKKTMLLASETHCQPEQKERCLKLLDRWK